MLVCGNCGLNVNGDPTRWSSGLCNVCIQTRAMMKSTSDNAPSSSSGPMTPDERRSYITFLIVALIGMIYFSVSTDLLTIKEVFTYGGLGVALWAGVTAIRAVVDKIF